MKLFKGVIVPMVTPINENYSIDDVAVQKIVTSLLYADCAPFILGTTGEATSFSLSQKLDLVKSTVKAVNGRATSFAGISGTSLMESIECAKSYRDLGIDVMVTTLPYYYPITTSEMMKYFERLVEEINCPLVLYNMPGMVGEDIPLDVADILSYHPNIIGMKDSERNIQRIDKSILLWKDRKDFGFYEGWAAQSAHAVLNGADGIVPSTANFVPHLFKKLYSAAKNGNQIEAFRLQQVTDDLSLIYQKDRKLNESLPALKVLMSELGLCQPHAMLPMHNTRQEEYKVLRVNLRNALSEKDDSKKKYMLRSKPILAITMGDPAGIGPEIAAKYFASPNIYSTNWSILVGNAGIMQKALDLTGVQLKINVISVVSNAKFEQGIVNVFQVDIKGAEEIKYGEVSAVAGDLAFKSVTTAIDLAMKKLVAGTVTGPIHKESINKAGHKFAGHTEIYAHYTGTKKFAMLLVEESLKVIHVSTHVSIRQACDLVKKERVLEVIHLINDGLKRLGINQPRIGVAGLNPHASDGGLFGHEDADEILPAVEQAKREGVIADGPIPPDTLFAMAYGGKYDGCVAMYHDQGHIPFKVIGFNWDQKTKKMKSVKGVNITLGLPIIRTSVDHGTAFEIAGKGIASPDALFYAVEYAQKLLTSKST